MPFGSFGYGAAAFSGNTEVCGVPSCNFVVASEEFSKYYDEIINNLLSLHGISNEYQTHVD